MKRILAFVMIFMLLCGSALATGTNTNASLSAQVATRWQTSSITAEDHYAKTELWLQVAATGQIDVTVPLVLVFSTNIEGGEASGPSKYFIKNNSSADLVVTKIETVVKDQVTGETLDIDSNPMELVEFGTGKPATDEYAIKLNVEAQTDRLGEPRGAYEFDLFEKSDNKEAKNGGLFLLKRGTAAAGTDTTVVPTMKTGELSFVTSEGKGVYLLTITYTVAIDKSTAIGEDITTSASDMYKITSTTP